MRIMIELTEDGKLSVESGDGDSIDVAVATFMLDGAKYQIFGEWANAVKETQEAQAAQSLDTEATDEVSS